MKKRVLHEKQKACGQNEKHSTISLDIDHTRTTHQDQEKNKQKKEENVPGKRIYFCLDKNRWIKLIRESTIRRNEL